MLFGDAEFQDERSGKWGWKPLASGRASEGCACIMSRIFGNEEEDLWVPLDSQPARCGLAGNPGILVHDLWTLGVCSLLGAKDEATAAAGKI